jgi:tetratricopeptide (TPR) repeat protein
MNPERSPVLFVLSVFVTVLALAELWAAFTPTGLNWGIHCLGFYGLGIRLAIPFLMLLCLVPAVQTFIVALIGKTTEHLGRRSRPIRVALATLFLVGVGLVFWYFRERMYLLGDGQLCLRSIRNIGTLEQLMDGFKREPLAGFFIVLFSNLFTLLKSPIPSEDAFRWLSILSGICCTIVAWRIAKHLSTDRIEQSLFFLLMIASGASQLFFGYIENYPPAYAAIFLFFLLSIAYLKKTLSIAWAVVAYIALLLLHLGALVFLPALLFLLFVSLRRKEYAELGATIFLAGVVLVVLLSLCGYTPEGLYAIFEGTGHFLLPLTLPLNTLQAYTFFTWNHLVDVMNLLLLCSPAGMILILGAAILYREKPRSFPPELWFLLLAAACGLSFVVVLNCELGMSRDWDILAPFGSTVVIAVVGVWCVLTEEKKLRYNALALLGMVSVLHTAAWIGVNADEQRGMERFRIIQDERLWSVHARADAEEELAIYYRQHNQLEKTAEHYAKYVAVDSTNARVWKNLAELYEIIGNTQKAIETYGTIIRLKMDDPYILTNLAMIYEDQQRYSEAYDLLLRAEAGNLNSPVIENNIGVVLMKGKGDHRKALPFFLRAIQYDSSYTAAYINAALCYDQQGDTGTVSRYMARIQQLSSQGRATR